MKIIQEEIDRLRRQFRDKGPMGPVYLILRQGDQTIRVFADDHGGLVLEVQE